MPKLAARLLVPAAAICLLAGCATPSGQTAFDVNGTRTTLGDIDRAADGCVEISGGQVSRAEIKTTVAQMMLAGDVAKAIGDATDTVLSAKERAAEFEKQGGQKLTQNAECARAINGFIDYQAMLGKIGAPKMLDEARKLDVVVNPRYGTWSADKGSFTNSSGSLSSEDLGLGKVYGG